MSPPARWRVLATSFLMGGLWIGLTGLPAGCSRSEPDARAGNASSEAAPGEEDASLAPDFTLADLNGQDVSLRGLRGRTVVIDFWATWCAPCVYQIPVLNEFHDSKRGDGVIVLGISVDAEGHEVVAPFAEEHGIRYQVLLGDESIARRFGVPGFPALVVIGPEGRVEGLHVGVADREVLDEMVARTYVRAGLWERSTAGAPS